MSARASQITSLTIAYSSVYSGADKKKHENSASLAFVRGIHRGPVNSLHKWPVMRKIFPFDDFIMYGSADYAIKRKMVRKTCGIIWRLRCQKQISRKGQVFASYSILWKAITYPCRNRSHEFFFFQIVRRSQGSVLIVNTDSKLWHLQYIVRLQHTIGMKCERWYSQYVTQNVWWEWTKSIEFSVEVWPRKHILTHWGRNKIDALLQTKCFFLTENIWVSIKISQGSNW